VVDLQSNPRPQSHFSHDRSIQDMQRLSFACVPLTIVQVAPTGTGTPNL
jgi:hypothetical protein